MRKKKGCEKKSPQFHFIGKNAWAQTESTNNLKPITKNNGSVLVFGWWFWVCG
jgi:hypothetical protein